MPLERFDEHGPVRRDRQVDFRRLALAHDRQRYRSVPGGLLNHILKLDSEIVLQPHHPHVVDVLVADPGDEVPGLQRIVRFCESGSVDNHPVALLVKLKEAPQGWVFQRLELIVES